MFSPKILTAGEKKVAVVAVQRELAELHGLADHGDIRSKISIKLARHD